MRIRNFALLVILMISYIPSSLARTERRFRHHKNHHRDGDSKSVRLPSLAELQAQSAELTKAFQRNAEELREKVRESEDSEAADYQSPSFLQVETAKKPEPGIGLRAMEAVTEKIMRFTEKMRKMGNEVSLFTN
jgi:hypothetical protein